MELEKSKTKQLQAYIAIGTLPRHVLTEKFNFTLRR